MFAIVCIACACWPRPTGPINLLFQNGYCQSGCGLGKRRMCVLKSRMTASELLPMLLVVLLSVTSDAQMVMME